MMLEHSNSADDELYKQLVESLYKENPPITLPSEYASFLKSNLLRLLIRLARYKFVVKMIKNTDKVLEIGCGSGLGSIFIAQNCKSVLGIDLKEHEITEAKSICRRDNVEFKCMNFYDFPRGEKFNVIVMLDVVEHMPEEDAVRFIEQTTKHLAEDGMLIIGTPSIYSYQYQGELSRAGHVKCYDQDELVRLIEQYYKRTVAFSMNDELVHTGFSKMAWYYFVLAFFPKQVC